MEKKNNIEENHFWPGFFLGAALGIGVIYFLQEDDPKRKEKIVQVIRDLLSSSNNSKDKKAQVTKRTFRRHGKAIS